MQALIVSSVVLGTGFTLLFETVVIGLTWAKTADIIYLLKKENPHTEKRTSYLLLRDGEW